MASGERDIVGELMKYYKAAAKAKQATTSRHQTATTARQKTPMIYEGFVPTEMSNQRAAVPEDPLQAKIDERRKQPIISEEILKKYADISIDFRDFNSDFTRRVVKYDFRDDEWKDESGIILERLTDIEVADLGRKVIPMISSGFSRRGAAAVFVLAYHLKTPGAGSTRRRYVFGDPTFEKLTDFKYEDYEEKIMIKQGPKEVSIPTNDELEAMVYAYLCASMLRLFTKPPSNYVKSWSHIVNSFSKFYGDDVRVLRLPTPLESAIHGLANWFSIERRAKVTLYRILYMSNANHLHADLKRFLYEVHLSNTGMHILPIMEQLCHVLKCTPGEIIAVVQTSQYERQIRCLLKIFDILDNKDEQHSRGMWRYGRIFDETFMSDLQTKRCPQLVYLLACALQLKSPTSHSGILQIAQLANVSDYHKKRCMESAHRLLKMIQSSGTNTDHP